MPLLMLIGRHFIGPRVSESQMLFRIERIRTVVRLYVLHVSPQTGGLSQPEELVTEEFISEQAAREYAEREYGAAPNQFMTA